MVSNLAPFVPTFCIIVDERTDVTVEVMLAYDSFDSLVTVSSPSGLGVKTGALSFSCQGNGLVQRFCEFGRCARPLCT